MKHYCWISVSLLLFSSQSALSGASCVVAKKLGNSLAIEWVAAEGESAASATQKAQERLLQQGLHGRFQDAHPQASTELRHAHMVIVKTEYQTVIGRLRTSYGCGYSTRSPEEAEQAALYDLRNYSWGWKADFGYEVFKRLNF
jgi:hypothetical protein